MKKLAIIFCILAPLFAHAQIGARWDLGSPGMNGVTTVSGSGLPVLLAVPNVQLNWCAYPANAVPCTNYAPTYTSITLLTQCPSSTPIVLQQSSTCVGTSDTYGNLGAYTPVGTYSYTLTSNGVSSGPYTVTVGAVNGNFVDVTSNQTIAGNKTLTGATLAAALNNQVFADLEPGADCGAKINAADAALGSAAGIILISSMCQPLLGTSITTTWALSNYHILQFIQGTTLTYSASGTLNQYSAIVTLESAVNDDQGSEPKPSVVFQQANGANLTQAITVAGSHASISNVYIGGNRSNNTTGSTGILVNSDRFTMYNSTVADFSSDGVKLNSTGTSDQAEGFQMLHSSLNRNGGGPGLLLGNGLNCFNTEDVYSINSFFDFNYGWGIDSTNCTMEITHFDNSVNNLGGIHLGVHNNDYPASGELTKINDGSFGENGPSCTPGRGYDIDIDGYDTIGPEGNLVTDTEIKNNRMVGGGAASNTCDSIHVQDSNRNLIEGNRISSSTGNTFRFGIGIYSVNETEGRDHVLGNSIYGTFGTGAKIGTAQTLFCENMENGDSTFEECDAGLQYTPNAQTWNAKESNGTVFGVWEPLDGSNNMDWYVPSGGGFNWNVNNVTVFQINSSGVTIPGNLTVDGTCTGCTGSASVTSFNTRTGAITPTTGDYTCSQVTGCSASGGLPGTWIYVTPGSNQSAIQAFLNSASAGDWVIFSGSYAACGLTMTTAGVTIDGLNRDGTSITCGTANSPVLTVSGNVDRVMNINLKHSTTPTCPGGALTSTCGDGIQVLGGASRVTIEDVHTNFDYNGIDVGYTDWGEIANNISEFNQNADILVLPASGHTVYQWNMHGNLMQQSLGSGLDMTCPASITSLQMTAPYLQNGGNISFGNVGYGYKFSCSAATTSGIADVFMSGNFASQDNASGLYLDQGPNGGRNALIGNFYSEQAGTYTGTAGYAQASQSATNTGYGIEITSSCDATVAPNITGATLWANSFSGAITACAGTTFSNISTRGNGAAGASAQTESGITINASNVSITGGNFKSGGAQASAIYILGGDTPSISGFTSDFSTPIVVGTAPTNGFQQWVGSVKYITGSGVPSMACGNGWHYNNAGATSFSTAEYVCYGNAWTPVTVP
jgi:hypothetical protein